MSDERGDMLMSCEEPNSIIKKGYLHMCDDLNSKPQLMSRYYVLKKSTLECYANEKCDLLQQSYSLTVINDVTPTEDDAVKFSIIFSCHPMLILCAQDENEQHDWVKSLSTGSTQCSLKQECTEQLKPQKNNLMEIFPLQYVLKKLCVGDDTLQVHGECSMIKYARNGKTIPHERIFKVDKNYLHMMWKKSRRSSSYRLKCSASFGQVTEVRCGQQTRNFNLFPYIEVENQSFSLIIERDQGEWCGLDSLDVICDSVLAFEQWKQALEIIIYGKDGKLPIRDGHKICDPIELFLKRHWSTLTENDIISLDTCINFMWQFNDASNKRVFRTFMRDMFKNYIFSGKLNFQFFFCVFNTINRHTQLYEYFTKYAKTFPQLGLTPQEFITFLKQEQKIQMLDLESVPKLIKYHDRNNGLFKKFCAGNDLSGYHTSTNMLSFHGFVSFLRSADNAVIRSKTKQDMTRPLSDYFINSSHNTYLTGHQLKGLSSCEAYVYALQQGCRCLEIDCWNGPDEPVVTHGLTLTSKIKLRDVLEIIKVYGFDVSPYPIILSIENHCSVEQQRIMAKLFEETFGDMLATENLSVENNLPSPESLKHKIILKGNLKTKKKTLAQRTIRKMSKQRSMSKSDDMLSSTSPVRNARAPSTTSQLDLSPSFPIRNARSPSTTSQLEVLSPEAKSAEGEMVQVPLEDTMGRLIVYCHVIPFKRGDMSQNCCEMHSFSESAIGVLGERIPLDILYLSRRKLIRSYPRGSRVDSSNYNPMIMWRYGVHMASVNMQKPDIGYHINTGFFLKSHGTGYVLKSPPISNKVSNFHPQMSRNPIGENMMTLQLEIICGQFVDKTVFMNLPVSIEVETIGVEADCDSFITEPIAGKMLNMVWEKNSHAFNLIMPSLCLLYVKVYSVSRVNKMVYQTCLPVDMIKPGLRYIPIKTLTGVEKRENGLFVKIDISMSRDKKRNHTDVQGCPDAETHLKARSRLYTM